LNRGSPVQVFVPAWYEDFFSFRKGDLLAITRQKKEDLVREYGERLGRSQVTIWSAYKGLTVAQVTALRNDLRQAGAEAVVVKNTLMRRALEGADLPVDPSVMDGSCIVTFVYDEIAPATKVVTDFARANTDEFTVQGGIVGGQIATAAQVSALTSLPSREILLGQVVGGIQAPISGFVNVLAGVIRSFANVLNARKDQLEGSEA